MFADRSSCSARTCSEISVRVTIPNRPAELRIVRELMMTGKRPPPLWGRTKECRLWPALSAMSICCVRILDGYTPEARMRWAFDPAVVLEKQRRDHWTDVVWLGGSL